MLQTNIRMSIPIFLIRPKAWTTEYLPDPLSFFLNDLCPDTSAMLKKAALGQCLMQMVKARGLMLSILFGLGVQLQHQFASRFLIDTLNTLEFSISYAQVMNLLRSAALANKDIIKQIESN
jgi:hypothetical protein